MRTERDTREEMRTECRFGLATSGSRSFQTDDVSAGRAYHGDRGCTNPPKDHMTETKLTRDLRNDNYTATSTVLHSCTEI